MVLSPGLPFIPPPAPRAARRHAEPLARSMIQAPKWKPTQALVAPSGPKRSPVDIEVAGAKRVRLLQHVNQHGTRKVALALESTLPAEVSWGLGAVLQASCGLEGHVASEKVEQLASLSRNPALLPALLALALPEPPEDAHDVLRPCPPGAAQLRALGRLHRRQAWLCLRNMAHMPENEAALLQAHIISYHIISDQIISVHVVACACMGVREWAWRARQSVRSVGRPATTPVLGHAAGVHARPHHLHLHPPPHPHLHPRPTSSSTPSTPPPPRLPLHPSPSAVAVGAAAGVAPPHAAAQPARGRALLGVGVGVG